MKWATLNVKVSAIFRHSIKKNIQDTDRKHQRSNIATHLTIIFKGNPDSGNSDEEPRGEDQKQVESDTTAGVRGTLAKEEYKSNQGPESAEAKLFVLSAR
jgi:hypothetical protein